MGPLGSGRAARVAFVTLLLVLGLVRGVAAAEAGAGDSTPSREEIQARLDKVARSRITQQQREAAAARLKLAQSVAGLTSGSGLTASAASMVADMAPMPMPGGVPDYFGTTPNWAYSPPLRKFVDTLPGLGAAGANNLGQYISVAKPDTITYPGSDYYEIELRQFEERLHSDMPPTTLRGYVQVNKGTDGSGLNTLEPDPIHYLGPFIQARKDRPVRVKFTNALPTGSGGDLFIPVDTTVMGAGMGPLGMAAMPMNYTQNRATLHLHGGITPWISDGTPHQWITPAGEMTPYPKGVSVRNVPDMPDPGDGSMTFFYSNQQSARLMWYHDHTFGITRLNVYVGEAAGYAISDPIEDKLVADGTIPSDQIPIVIQDKTFVDSETVRTTDPTWNWGTGALDTTTGVRVPKTGDLWMPHVYVPAQNPADPGGMNATGRWHYSPWFWPPVTDIKHPPILNPYHNPATAAWEPELMPATPNPSMGMEAFQDTPVVNGAAYPALEVQPKSYRLKVLNAASDRFWNLQMYVADPAVVTSDGRRNTEVKMVPAAATAGFPELWPTDGREGGAPDPATSGPEWIQIGTEGGFLPKPAIIPQQPITWNHDPTTFNAGNVQDHSLLLGPAERADVIVDFSAYAGKTLILYNDAPAAFPALDPRMDYYTGAPDMTDTGGTAGTDAGFGPNTRTIMQIKVAAAPAAPAFDLDALEAAFASTDARNGVFEAGQNPIILPDSRYDSAYNATFAADPYVRIFENEKRIRTLDSRTVTMPLEPKAIQDETSEVWDLEYGRMSGKLGLEMPRTNAGNANFIMYSFFDPPTEILKDSMTPLSKVGEDGTQIWKITHNGVDTHPIHFHLFDVQVINRVGWDNGIRPPDDNELGWKDTVRISPLEDTIVALRPVAPKLPFGLPDSRRPYDVTMPIGNTEGFSNLSPVNGQPIVPPIANQIFNFGWEYMWHCHILSHEEMEMMRPVTLDVARSLPATPSLAATGLPGAPIALKWIDTTPPTDPDTWGDSANEIGFRVERAEVDAQNAVGAYSVITTALANATSFTDTTTVGGTAYAYRVFAFNEAGSTGSNVFRIGPPGYFSSYVVTPSAFGGGLAQAAQAAAAAARELTAQSVFGDGTVEPPDPQTLPAGGDAVTMTMTPDAHHHVADVWLDGVSAGPLASYTFTNVLNDHTLWAFFAIDTYDIVPSVVGSGSISPSTTQTVDWNSDSATFTLTADPHHHIADVLVDGSSIGAVPAHKFTNVDQNHTIQAVFAVDTYTITPTAGPNGSIGPAGPQVVAHGSDSVTFTIAPDAGYQVANVLVDGSSVGSVREYRFTNVTGPHTISASFVEDGWVYRFFNLVNSTHFYTASYAEAQSVQANLGWAYRYEGTVFRTYLGVSGVPVHRFYNFRRGTHFYTASEAEMLSIRANLGWTYRYEGVGFYASPTTANAVPVHRFFNFATGSHFFTASTVEKDAVTWALGWLYRYEGIAFYAPG